MRLNAAHQDSEKSDTDQTIDSDSDNELEIAKVQALLRRGKERLDAEDFGAAERLFRNCLTQTISTISLSSVHRTSKAEIMFLLVKTYQQQQKWSEAQSILIEKITSGSRSTAGDNGDVLSDILTLVDVLMRKRAYAEAHLYARRAHKGYRRMGESGVDGVRRALQLLIDISRAEGNTDEEEAYTAIVSDYPDKSPLMASMTRQPAWPFKGLDNLHLDGSEPRIFPGIAGRNQRKDSSVEKGSVSAAHVDAGIMPSPRDIM